MFFLYYQVFKSYLNPFKKYLISTLLHLSYSLHASLFYITSPDSTFTSSLFLPSYFTSYQSFTSSSFSPSYFTSYQSFTSSLFLPSYFTSYQSFTSSSFLPSYFTSYQSFTSSSFSPSYFTSYQSFTSSSFSPSYFTSYQSYAMFCHSFSTSSPFLVLLNILFTPILYLVFILLQHISILIIFNCILLDLLSISLYFSQTYSSSSQSNFFHPTPFYLNPITFAL